MKWTIKQGTETDIQDIAQFQVDMAAESEGTVLGSCHSDQGRDARCG